MSRSLTLFVAPLSTRHAPLNNLDESDLEEYFQIVIFIWQTRFCCLLCIKMEGVALVRRSALLFILVHFGGSDGVCRGESF
jgi:hypothetical protein